MRLLSFRVVVVLGLSALGGGLTGQGSTGPDVVTVLKGHTDTVDAVAVSPDGKFLATGSFDKMVKLWDLATGKEVRTFGGPQGHQGMVLAVGFSPKGDLLATGGLDNVVKVWDVSSTQPAAVLAAAGSAAVAFPLPNKPPKPLPHPNLVNAVAFDPTGTQLVTGGQDGIVRIFDVQKAAVTKQITAHVQPAPQNRPRPVYFVTWAAGGKQLLSASDDRTLKLWDAASGNLVREFKAAADPKPGDKPPTGPVGHRDQVFAAAFSKDGKFLASASSDRTIKLWDVATGAVIRDFPNPDLQAVMPGEPAPSHPGWVHGIVFTPDDKVLVSAGAAPRNGGYLAAWSVADGKRLAGIEGEFGPVRALVLTPDGTRAILGCGPRSRGETDAGVLIVKVPGR